MKRGPYPAGPEGESRGDLQDEAFEDEEVRDEKEGSPEYPFGPPPAEEEGTGARLARAVGRGPLHAVIIGISILWMIPALGLLVSSFRERQAITRTGWWRAFTTPTEFTIQNYQDVLTGQGMGTAFINSVIITVPATILTVMVAALAAYAFAWMPLPGRNWWFLLVVALMVVPIQLTLIPVLRLFADLGLTGTYWGIWLAHAAYGLPLGVFLLRNFFVALPKDLLESAFLEGASHTTAFFRIVLPLSVPSLAALGIFQFLWVWNDLLIALVYLGGTRDVAPMTVVISNLVSSFGTEWHLLTAAAFVSVILPLAIFFALQRYFVQGLLAGAVKG
ncbi:MAG TPA: carbohydrate ABC transporter permease [Thermoleophilia bacterium]|nr:carbohydrate ABC transporter permease [Thermoleophilia bacterium]